jgi:hypothetical protein
VFKFALKMLIKCPLCGLEVTNLMPQIDQSRQIGTSFVPQTSGFTILHFSEFFGMKAPSLGHHLRGRFLPAFLPAAWVNFPE